MQKTNHLVTIAHPLHPFFIVSILHLRDSLFVWAGETTLAAADDADQYAASSQTGSSSAVTAPAETIASVQTLTAEEQRQAQVDQQIEDELSQALAAAGRNNVGDSSSSSSSSTAAMPKGVVAREWAASMWNENAQQSLGTSLFRTPSDIALPMSRRISKRLQIPQLHLSLSLPNDLFPPSGNMPAPPGANGALLAIEQGIQESIEAATRQQHGGGGS